MSRDLTVTNTSTVTTRTVKTTTDDPTLTVGDRGAAVRKLEAALVKQKLLKGKADGVFDPATAAAVKKLETANGFKADGKVGKKVWELLGGAGEGSGPVLKKGSEGATVKELQKALKKQGHYKGPVDGDFGPVTEKALKAFEKKNKLTVDGKAGNEVWEKLGTHAVEREEIGGPRLSLGMKGAAVKKLQSELKERGLYAGKLTGVFSAETKAAVQKLEKSKKYEADGVVGNRLWRALGGAGKGSGPTLKKGSDGQAVDVLQKALKARGLYNGPIDGDFGPVTEGALKKFQKQRGLEANGVAGKAVWGELGKHLVLSKPNPIGVEPKHDYRHVHFRGAEVNVRTKQMIINAEALAKKAGVAVPIFVVQGSYSHHVSASGGTHDGGGALDIRTSGRSLSEVSRLVKALRQAGFAAWKRGYGGDPFSPHIHAIAIGDRQLSSAARNQVAEYFRGGDGLVGSALDGDRGVGRPYPKWAEKYR